jgi:Tat protein translocase TatB subunit
MLNIGPLELLLVLVVALVVVGPQRLPELGRTVGKAIRELRRAQDEFRDSIRLDLDDELPHVPPRPRPHGGVPRAADDPDAVSFDVPEIRSNGAFADAEPPDDDLEPE